MRLIKQKNTKNFVFSCRISHTNLDLNNVVRKKFRLSPEPYLKIKLDVLPFAQKYQYFLCLMNYFFSDIINDDAAVLAVNENK